MGTDLSVANAARVSLHKESEYDYDEITYTPILREKDESLIAFLVREGHWLPFRHPQITFRCSAPIFVARQLGKHQVGFSWSEVSRRYVDETPEFYEPDEWRMGSKDIKQGSLGAVDSTTRGAATDVLKRIHYEAEVAYEKLLSLGVAKEQARMILPQTMMTEWIWTGSLLGWATMYNLRSKPDTQKETRDFMSLVAPQIEDEFPVSWGYLTYQRTPQ